MRRRLQEQDQEAPDGKDDTEEGETDGEKQNENIPGNADPVQGELGDNKEEENEEGQVVDETADADEDEEDEEEVEGEQDQDDPNEDDVVETVPGGDSGDAEDEITGHGGFEIKGGDEEEEDDGGEEPVTTHENNQRPGMDQVDDVVANEQNAVEGARTEPKREERERDFSTYDTWMGILSASSVKYFVRIVPSSEVGVLSLEDYDRSRSETK